MTPFTNLIDQLFKRDCKHSENSLSMKHFHYYCSGTIIYSGSKITAKSTERVLLINVLCILIELLLRTVLLGYIYIYIYIYTERERERERQWTDMSLTMSQDLQNICIFYLNIYYCLYFSSVHIGITYACHSYISIYRGQIDWEK